MGTIWNVPIHSKRPVRSKKRPKHATTGNIRIASKEFIITHSSRARNQDEVSDKFYLHFDEQGNIAGVKPKEGP